MSSPCLFVVNLQNTVYFFEQKRDNLKNESKNRKKSKKGFTNQTFCDTIQCGRKIIFKQAQRGRKIG